MQNEGSMVMQHYDTVYCQKPGTEAGSQGRVAFGLSDKLIENRDTNKITLAICFPTSDDSSYGTE